MLAIFPPSSTLDIMRKNKAHQESSSSYQSLRPRLHLEIEAARGKKAHGHILGTTN